MSGCDAAATAAPSPSAMNPRPRPPFSKLFSVAGGGAALFTFPPTPLPLAMSSTTSTEKATVAPRLSLIRVGEDKDIRYARMINMYILPKDGPDMYPIKDYS